MGKNCGYNCKHFHGECTLIDDKLTFNEWCDKDNDTFKRFNEAYKDKNAAWVDKNVIMDCFEPSEIVDKKDDYGFNDFLD